MTRAGLPQTLRAEWIKARSLRSTAWILLAGVSLTLAFTFLICSGSSTEGGSPGNPGDNDIVRDSLVGAWLGQIAFVLLAVVVIASEYSSGTIRATFAANPRRRIVLGAKAAILGALVLAIGFLTTAASFVVGQWLLRGNGFNYEGGYPAVTLADGPALRAVAGTALYLTGLALLSFGIAAIVRRQATAISIALGLVFVPWIAVGLLPEADGELVQQLSPTIAGLAVQQTVERPDNIPLGPWVGLGVLGAYALASLVLAFWLVSRRDV